MASSASAKPTDGAPAGAVVVPVEAGAAAAEAGAQAQPAWTRLSARLVWVLAAALFLLGCAEAGLALLAMILPAGKATCAPNAEVPSIDTAMGCLIMGVYVQMLAAIMAVAGPAWQVVVLGTFMGAFTAWLFPAHHVLWLFVSCDGVLLAFAFWFFYAVMWPVAAIGAVVALKLETEDHRPSSS